MRPHIFLATPCYGGMVTQGYMQSVIGALQAASTHGYDLTLALLGQDALITRSRNTLLGHFMANHSATHILFVDADISFPADLTARLIAHDKEIVGAVYPIKQYFWDSQAERRILAGEPISSAGLRYVGETSAGVQARREGAFATANYIGTGFMLISRAAVLKLIAHFPQTRYDAIHCQAGSNENSPQFYALFECMIDPATRTYLSEDFAFCHRWRSIGGELWLDTQSILTHSGLVDLAGDPQPAFALS